ncbi:NADH-FMN oxidoreductase RutF, flavin reductase (DIM6/NTAB) family [Micromonospora rhizosphaerae]|uniref:NADH-FMN oxidoreductase RutF, flavin reductase (DIM6/NTAB) family n=1 Tax=Micromonospora rhizosphaerae TaxID=568872 RepID=A0A1C6S059_9ACTN|nr:flavin reductase family protein [Micromonospora rhizosphaerae]SCL22853.1 NADH-FMN oxidoreductase RutF, flavin reductase (DIM6/NTAB) family [Micromonospora rhizosphaerae]
MTTVDRPGAGAVELRPVDRDLFRALLRRQASTVTVVTTPGLAGGRHLPSLPPAAFTATSFTSVALDPPLVSLRLDRESSGWPTVQRTEHLAVHLLAPGRREVTRTFDTSGIDRFATHRGWTDGPFGVPLIDGALAVLLCRVVRRIEAGAHTIVLGEPLALGAGKDDDAVARHRGDYTTTTFGPWPSPW